MKTQQGFHHSNLVEIVSTLFILLRSHQIICSKVFCFTFYLGLCMLLQDLVGISQSRSKLRKPHPKLSIAWALKLIHINYYIITTFIIIITNLLVSYRSNNILTWLLADTALDRRALTHSRAFWKSEPFTDSATSWVILSDISVYATKH